MIQSPKSIAKLMKLVSPGNNTAVSADVWDPVAISQYRSTEQLVSEQDAASRVVPESAPFARLDSRKLEQLRKQRGRLDSKKQSSQPYMNIEIDRTSQKSKGHSKTRSMRSTRSMGMISVQSRCSSVMSSTFSRANQRQNVKTCSFKQKKCSKVQYRRQLCKDHFIKYVTHTLRKVVRAIYIGPQQAFGAIDFAGTGYISQDAFLRSFVANRSGLNNEEIKDYFFLENVFKQGEQGITFSLFKNLFFPWATIAGSAVSPKAEEIKKGQSKEDLRKELIANMKKLDDQLRDRFSRDYDSVKKAFLQMDTNFDGLVEPEDVMRLYGSTLDCVFTHLVKIMKEKDSKGIGKLNYADFSKWMGGAIHQPEGFYFRHDSSMNPVYYQFQQLQEKLKGDDKRKAAAQFETNEVILEKVIKKMRQQWKTVRKAFTDLNANDDEFIQKEELEFYLAHWGLSFTPEQLDYIFKYFDHNQDGSICYRDFAKTIGAELHPGETQYFRMDVVQHENQARCSDSSGCWGPPLGTQNYCQRHFKFYLAKCEALFQSFYETIGADKWPNFLKELRQAAEKDNRKQIFLGRFCKLLEKYGGIKLRSSQKLFLHNTYPGRDEGSKWRINIDKLYHLSEDQIRLQVHNEPQPSENKDAISDHKGYLGLARPQRAAKTSKLEMTQSELVDQIYSDNQLKNIFLKIKEIDPEKNGFVTSTELQDIFHITYADNQEFQTKSIKEAVKHCQSLQNQVLINYGKFREWIFLALKEKASTDESCKLAQAKALLKRRRQQKQSLILSQNKSTIGLSQRSGTSIRPMSATSQADLFSRKSLEDSQEKLVPEEETKVVPQKTMKVYRDHLKLDFWHEQQAAVNSQKMDLRTGPNNIGVAGLRTRDRSLKSFALLQNRASELAVTQDRYGSVKRSSQQDGSFHLRSHKTLEKTAIGGDLLEESHNERDSVPDFLSIDRPDKKLEDLRAGRKQRIRPQSSMVYNARRSGLQQPDVASRSSRKSLAAMKRGASELKLVNKDLQKVLENQYTKIDQLIQPTEKSSGRPRTSQRRNNNISSHHTQEIQLQQHIS